VDAAMSIKSQTDSIRYYIDTALALAEINPHMYERDIAGLKNELGFYVFRAGFSDEARVLFTESAAIYQKIGDSQYYADVLNNLLELEILYKDKRVADSLNTIIQQLVDKNSWFRTNVKLYNSLMIQSEFDGDSIGIWKNKYYALENQLALNSKVNNEKMLQLREQFELEKLEKNIAKEEEINRINQIELLEEKSSKNRLYFIVIIALLVMLLSFIFIVRERSRRKELDRTNEELNTSNNKYQMLIKESNHRIKNNLQMIASMVDYTGCLLYTSPSPRDRTRSRMPSSA